MDLSDRELARIVRAIGASFDHYKSQYEDHKYPPGELERLRGVFARLDGVGVNDIEAALIWKYGYWGKESYPEHQRRLAARIVQFWSRNAIRPGCDLSEAMQEWRLHVGRTSYITFCFLVHLTQPSDYPILDQHNFRSVNHHLGRRGSIAKLKPSTIEDLELVRRFSSSVLNHWARASSRPAPSRDEFDRYLMMHGKSLKPARRSAMN